MTNYCSYKDCSNIHRSFASKTFFNLPTDSRREIWIKNSGNERLHNLDASLRRVFCEDHFDEKYLRRQFNRTILRRDAIPYPYGEAPARQEIEYIEMAESEEEPELCQSETIESSNEHNPVVILLNKSANTGIQQGKATNVIIKQNPNKSSEKKIVHVTKDLKRKPATEENDEEIDFIVMEENSQGAFENSHESVENDEPESIPSKKMRVEIEQITHESSQPEKEEEITIQKPTARTIFDVMVPRNSTDGIVSSSETVDANNEETYFALSLVGILKRLPPHKRAVAKCHILSYLTELEYGSSSLS